MFSYNRYIFKLNSFLFTKILPSCLHETFHRILCHFQQITSRWSELQFEFWKLMLLHFASFSQLMKLNCLTGILYYSRMSVTIFIKFVSVLAHIPQFIYEIFRHQILHLVCIVLQLGKPVNITEIKHLNKFFFTTFRPIFWTSSGNK